MYEGGAMTRIRELCGPIARRMAEEWQLELGDELPGASASLVLAAQISEGVAAVLKVPIPGDDEVESWRGVNAFASYGGVSILRVDEETGSILMPRLVPGTKLGESDLSDLESVDVCAELILRLRQAPVSATLPLENWFRQLDDAQDSSHVTEAKRIARHLNETTDRVVNLHGDLHQFNIIQSDKAWVVIDPKFLVGDPAHEVVGFMRNCMQQARDANGMRARLERFAERLGDPIERLWGWSFAQTVLCSAWSSEPVGDSFWNESLEAIWEAKP
jgi:streptomycin 6-kinase